MAETKTEKLSGNNLLIVLVLITLLVVGISGLVVKTLIGSIAIDTKVVSAKHKADNQLTSDVAAAPNLVNAFSALGSQTQVLADALPDDSDFPGLLVTLENMTNDAGMKLKSVDPVVNSAATTSVVAPAGGNSSTPTPQPYAFSLTFDGTYSSLVKLMGDVETSARPMRVVGLQLAGSGSAMSGEVDIQTYFQDKGQLPFSTETIK